jgi:hypothetical protein
MSKMTVEEAFKNYVRRNQQVYFGMTDWEKDADENVWRAGVEWQEQQMIGEVTELKEALKWALDNVEDEWGPSEETENYRKRFGLE